MITKFSNFEKLEEEKELKDDYASLPGSPASDVIVGSRSTTKDNQTSKKKEENFDRSIFDPDKYIQFDSAVKNIISYNQKQKNFERRKDEASRRAYLDRSRIGTAVKSCSEAPSLLMKTGYTDGFILSTRTAGSRNL
jgi:hypothetical protein